MEKKIAEARKITFGKYKGERIKKLIIEHIGYIMWCLDNLKWFSLNEEEQALYDAQAISIYKSGLKMVFPTEDMLKHVKNKMALEHLTTPIITLPNGQSLVHSTDKSMTMFNGVQDMFGGSPRQLERSSLSTHEGMKALAHCMQKQLDYDEQMGMPEEELFIGWED